MKISIIAILPVMVGVIASLIGGRIYKRNKNKRLK